MSGKTRTLFIEKYGSAHAETKYLISPDTQNVVVMEGEKESFQSLGQIFKSVFLPQGYPESVSEDYLVYQMYDTIQAFSSSITGTLATQALLKGVGVGNENATALAATITWILKDGTGMVGRILFAWVQGSSLDCDAKRWRLFADMLNDFAICLEISAPLFPSWFTVTVCVAGVFKSIVGVAGGCTRAALTLHQARRNNMADVSAKDGSQETLVNLAGLICSLLLVPVVAGHTALVWTLFVIFTALHLWANYSAVTSVIMETLNQARLHILAKAYITSDSEVLPSIKETNFKEPVILKTRWLYDIKLGSRLKQISVRQNDLKLLETVYLDEKYILAVDLSRKTIFVAFRKDSDVYDHLQAAFHAELINILAGISNVYTEASSNISKSLVNDNAINQILCSNFNTALSEGDFIAISKTTLQLTKNIFPHFLSELKHSGWITSHALLEIDEWRSSWGKALDPPKND